jgi:outer membrane protein insertion porin family
MATTRRAGWLAVQTAAAVLIVALACAQATAAVVASAEVRGHESLRERDVLAALSLETGRALETGRVAAGVDSVLALLADLGRPFATVSATWDTAAGDAQVVVVLDEGPRIVLGALEFLEEGGGDRASAVPERALRGSRTTPGSVIVEETLVEDIEALLAAYGRDGRPFAEVALPRFVEVGEDGRVTGTVTISEGTDTRFGDVVVAGNDVTREYVIVRETGIVVGEPYSDDQLAAVRPRLEKLPYLTAVDEPVVAVDPETGEATVGVTVREGTANRITGVLGLSGGPDGADEITGLVDVSLGNIAGTGRRASASWEQVRENETEISFAYTEPWVLGAPVDVGVEGSQSVRDTFYTTTEADLLVSARMGDRTRLTWSLGAERYVPGAADESTTTSARTAFEASYDGSDSVWNPTRGTRLTAGVEYSAKEYADDGRDESAGTFSVQAEQFLSVASRHVLALKAFGQWLESTEEDVPFHELLVLGGARSLRGYREEQFRGNRVAVGTLEYRLLLGRRSRVIAFADLGYWYREGSISAKGTELGYGIGLRGDTRLGTISLDYGLGEGDDLLDGKLHAGLIREF